MSKFVYGIEGIDKIGKSLLIEGIQQQLGYFQVIHFGKPRRLQAYANSIAQIPVDADPQLYNYQQVSFRNSMKLSQSGARIVFDRWHLGECVYAPLYRKYSGDYVFQLEKKIGLDQTNFVRLILLVEDFSCSCHFVSDGNSFDDAKRKEEQGLFIEAFNKSIIRDKRIICVTDPDTGLFRKPEDILKEAIEL